MCAEKSDFFHCPAYKLMISDIKSAVLKEPTTGGGPDEAYHDFDAEPEYEWTLTVTSIPKSNGEHLLLQTVNKSKPSIELDLKLIWIQGVVLRVEEDQEDGSLSLAITDDEEEHEALIHEYNTVPGGDHPDIKAGSYVAALGQLWSNDPKIILKATKLMLLDGTVHPAMWKDEVRLGKAFLAGLIKPVI